MLSAITWEPILLEDNEMNTKRKIEIFSAGCPVCDEAIALINSMVCPSCEVKILDTRQTDTAARVKEYGIRSLPAVVIDGKLAGCCADRGVDETVLRAAGVGVPKP